MTGLIADGGGETSLLLLGTVFLENVLAGRFCGAGGLVGLLILLN